MLLKDARVLLTGASGGLGRALAAQLANAGAALLLTGRDAVHLAAVPLPGGTEAQRLAADLTQPDGITELAAAARAFRANVLINNAGICDFALFETQDRDTIEAILTTCLVAPMQLTRALLPLLRKQSEAAIVNVGSAFGSIPFAGFAAYSAAKAGLRGFSQALRRELADTTVRVVQVAPRAIDTPLNSPAVVALNRALGSACDRPEDVAARILAQLQGGPDECHIGFPERLFARLNGFAPRLLDHALAGKLATIKRHATNPAHSR